MIIDLCSCVTYTLISYFSSHNHAVPSEPPQNLQYTKVTTHSITLTWEPPPLSAQNGVIIGYTIQVLKVDDNTSFNDFQVSKEPSLTVTGLDDDTTYNFSVAGNTSIGAGPYSMHISTKTIKNRGETVHA